MLTREQALQLFEYDASEGVLYWRPLPDRYENGRLRAKKHRTRKRAGSFNAKRNFINVQHEGQNYKAHRLVWLIVHGEAPAGLIDHVNGDGADNRLSNLRVATPGQNSQNLTLRADNTTGRQGVWLDKRRAVYCVELGVSGKRIRRSGFKSADEAYSEYLALKRAWHTFHPHEPRSR